MNGHVLVVDDDAAIRRLVQLALETEGIPVATGVPLDPRSRSSTYVV